jgi:hypothetical protein
LVCSKLFGLIQIKLIQIVTKYQILECNKLFVFNVNIGLYIGQIVPHLLQIFQIFVYRFVYRLVFVIFIIIYLKFLTHWAKFKILYWLRNYEKLQIVVNIQLYLVKFKNIWFISIPIWLALWITNEYSVSLKYSVYSDSDLNFKTEGKIKFT